MLKLQISDNVYEVDETTQNNLIDLLVQQGIAQFNKYVPTTARIFVEGMIVDQMRKAETAMLKAGKSVEEIKAMRPPRGTDYLEHVFKMVTPRLKGVIQNVTIQCECDGDGKIIAFSLAKQDQSTTGG